MANSFGFDESGARRIVAAVRKVEGLRPTGTPLTHSQPKQFKDWNFGILVEEGPELEGEPQPAWEDQRYWFKRALCVNDGAVTDELEFEVVDDMSSPFFIHATATNVAEQMDHTHLLVCGQIIQWWTVRSTEDNSIIRYEFWL